MQPNGYSKQAVANLIHAEIERWRLYRIKLENTPIYHGDDDWKVENFATERNTLQGAIDSTASMIVKWARQYFPELQLPLDSDMAIAAIVYSIPPPEDVRRPKQVSARGRG